MTVNLLQYIPEKLKKIDTYVFVFKRLLYVACFAWLVYLDHVIGSAEGYLQFGLKHYTGVILGIIILTAYSIKDFIKIPYLIWVIVFFIARPYALEWERTNYYNVMEFNGYLWNILVYGFVLIRMFYRFAIERKKPNMNWPAFAIYGLMVVWMIAFRSDVIWGLVFFPACACFYLTDFKEKDLNNLFTGAVEGLVLGFIIIQTQAFLYRPFDEWRYMGMYLNPNINALFFAFSYCAVLCKWYRMKLKRRNILLRLPCVILSGMLWALAFFTLGRTALITMLAVTVLFLLFQMLSRRRWKILELLIDGVALVAAAVICFVPTYQMARYIPAYVDKPMYFITDDSKDKIQQGDPVDSEKYIELERILEEGVLRIIWFEDLRDYDFSKWRFDEWDTLKDKLSSLFTPRLIAYAAETEEGLLPDTEQEVTGEPGSSSENPLLTPEEALDDVKVRTSIYKYYLAHLNLKGHPEGQPGAWITEEHSVPHAHNVLLQFAYDYGLPVGLLFAGLIVLALYTSVFGTMKHKQASWYYRLFMLGGFTIVFAGFGMLEIDWIYGELPMTMFFLMLYVVCHKRNTKENVVKTVKEKSIEDTIEVVDI